MLGTQAFVSKISIQLVNPLKPADQASFNVKLLGNPKVQIHIEGVVMGHKRPGVSASWYWLHNWRFDLEVSSSIEKGAKRGYGSCPLSKHLFGFMAD
jgi:hypothetical protein